MLTHCPWPSKIEAHPKSKQRSISGIAVVLPLVLPDVDPDVLDVLPEVVFQLNHVDANVLAVVLPLVLPEVDPDVLPVFRMNHVDANVLAVVYRVVVSVCGQVIWPANSNTQNICMK